MRRNKKTQFNLMGLATIASFSKPTIPQIVVKKYKNHVQCKPNAKSIPLFFHWLVQLEKSI
jgi:hypothetical protein